MSSPPNNDTNHKPTYAQVAANSPPPSVADDEETKSTGDFDHQQEKNVTTVGGANFSKPKGKDVVVAQGSDGKKPGDSTKPNGSISSTGSSEPEIINVEPPIPPPIDKMKKPVPQPTPEPAKPEPAKPEPAKKEEPAIMDNVADDCAPLKHTTMLTKEQKAAKKKQEESAVEPEFEIIDADSEKRRRRRNWILITGAGVAVAALVGVAVWKLTRKSHK